LCLSQPSGNYLNTLCFLCFPTDKKHSDLSLQTYLSSNTLHKINIYPLLLSAVKKGPENISDISLSINSLYLKSLSQINTASLLLSWVLLYTYRWNQTSSVRNESFGSWTPEKLDKKNGLLEHPFITDS
jgi:hypothetical protein